MTAQIHEILTIEGERMSMAFCPPLPRAHERIVRAVAEAVASGGIEETILHSTACWRGYQGSWEIKGGKLFLTGLRGRYTLVGSEPLLADWFTGVLRVPVGKRLKYVHMGFGSVYEGELHVKVEAGSVTASRTLDNTGTEHDTRALGWENLPGGENRFRGDDEL